MEIHSEILRIMGVYSVNEKQGIGDVMMTLALQTENWNYFPFGSTN